MLTEKQKKVFGFLAYCKTVGFEYEFQSFVWLEGITYSLYCPDLKLAIDVSPVPVSKQTREYQRLLWENSKISVINVDYKTIANSAGTILQAVRQHADLHK